jgi:cytochrome P450
VKDLYRWTFDPLALLDERARDGKVFPLGLWRKALVGYSPEWNKAILTDLGTFRSRGSLSGLTPYLRGGVVYLDQPAHDPRRRELNPGFHHQALTVLSGRLTATVAVPREPFDALGWARATVRRMLNAALFDSAFPPGLLARFLAPLESSTLDALRPRPLLFARMQRALAAIPNTLAPAMDAEELRVALAAAYDTTAHTLAFAVWRLAEHPQWQELTALPLVIDEVLRLHPAGWIGSRVAAADVRVSGVDIPRGTLVCYSPYLTHRDPELWPDPLAFRPERFTGRTPAWRYLPFAAGSRTCLGMHLARLMLITALTPLCATRVAPLRGDAVPHAGITLRPRGPLWVTASKVRVQVAAD